MREYKCIKCASKDLFIKEQNKQVGLYCGDCGRWQKWLNKSEKLLAERFIEFNKNKEGAK